MIALLRHSLKNVAPNPQSPKKNTPSPTTYTIPIPRGKKNCYPGQIAPCTLTVVAPLLGMDLLGLLYSRYYCGEISNVPKGS